MCIDCNAEMVTSGWRPWIKKRRCLSSLMGHLTRDCLFFSQGAGTFLLWTLFEVVSCWCEEPIQFINDLLNVSVLQGSLSRADFEQCLQAFFPLKDGEAIESLIKAAQLELPGETIQYKNLFTEVGSHIEYMDVASWIKLVIGPLMRI